MTFIVPETVEAEVHFNKVLTNLKFQDQLQPFRVVLHLPPCEILCIFPF